MSTSRDRPQETSRIGKMTFNTIPCDPTTFKTIPEELSHLKPKAQGKTIKSKGLVAGAVVLCFALSTILATASSPTSIQPTTSQTSSLASGPSPRNGDGQRPGLLRRGRGRGLQDGNRSCLWHRRVHGLTRSRLRRLQRPSRSSSSPFPLYTKTTPFPQISF